MLLQNILNRNDKSEHIPYLENVVRIIITWSAWLLTMIVVTGLLSLAMPPIPGGALTCYTVMFTQLGIPGEALALAVAINSMIDFIATASNLTCLQVEVTTVAGQLEMLDAECLRNPE